MMLWWNTETIQSSLIGTPAATHGRAVEAGFLDAIDRLLRVLILDIAAEAEALETPRLLLEPLASQDWQHTRRLRSGREDVLNVREEVSQPINQIGDES
jgi:hypothetical protein